MGAATMLALPGYMEPVQQVTKDSAKKAAGTYAKELGMRVKAWRIYMGVSAEVLARHCALSTDTIRSMEGGRMKASLDALTAISMAMGIELAQLMFQKPPKK